MPTHLYCLLAADSDSRPPTDVGDVRALAVGDVVAWVATTPDARLPRDARRAAPLVIEHDAVVGRAMARGVTPVPAALADPYSSDDAVTEDLLRRSAEIMESFRLVAGAVEMAVIIASRPTAASDESGAAVTGRAYLEGLRDKPKVLEAMGDEVDRQLAGLALASSRRLDRNRIGLSHLVRRGDIDAYRRIALADQSDRYQVVVDGPRAPYSFAAFSPSTGPGTGLPGRHETGRLGRD